MSDEDMIDWDALLAEGTETNEANVDSVATLDRDHDDMVTYDWDDPPSVFATDKTNEKKAKKPIKQ